jgi:hypothetical protein
MKNSIIFWNVMYIIGLIIIGFINWEVLVGILAGKSPYAFAFLVDSALDELDNFPAFHINFLSLFAMCLFGVGTALYFIFSKGILPLYDMTIRKFNKKLNNE